MQVIYDNVSRRSKGFGFVTMSSVEEVKEPIRKYSGHELDGREIWVNSGLPQRREESYFGGSREDIPIGPFVGSCRPPFLAIKADMDALAV
ncbi:29 kDa ribonucleoprotein A, chloroplastic-like protein [Tanacetum coccineum]